MRRIKLRLNRLDAHDRLLHLKKQDFNIADCCQDIIRQEPFGKHAFYIFAHTRTDDDGVRKRLIWQPRLTKPLAQTNSMLFKAYPGSDEIKVIWIIPEEHLWKQYKVGNVTENKTVLDSIDKFKNQRALLEADLSDFQIDQVYKDISFNAKYKRID